MDTDVPLLAVGIRTAVFIFSFLAIGFFSGSETAFLGMDVWAVNGLASLGNRRANILKSLFESKETTLAALLVGTNIFTVLASVMGVSIAALGGFRGRAAMVSVPLFITILVFVFSELVPKSYAAEKPTETALAAAFLLSVAVRWLKPVAQVAVGLPVLFSKLIAPKADTIPSVTDGAVRAAVDLAGSTSYSSKEDSDVIYGVLDSSDTRLGEIMVPLAKATTFAPSTTLGEALDSFKTHRFSRVPVLDKKTGHVLGVVYMKDVVREIIQVANPADTGIAATSTAMGRDRAGAASSVAAGSGATVLKVARKAFVADIGQNVLDLLARMRKNRVHFAVVVHSGKPVGIVTIEDLIEEILGDIPEDSMVRMKEYRGLALEDDPSSDTALGCGDLAG